MLNDAHSDPNSKKINMMIDPRASVMWSTTFENVSESPLCPRGMRTLAAERLQNVSEA